MSRLARFRDWWRAPATRADRVRGAFVGFIAGFWLGALGRIALGPTAMSLTTVLLWGLAGAVVTAIAGAIFPKTVSVALFPFATFGTGP